MAGAKGKSGMRSGKPRLSPKVLEEMRARIDTNNIIKALSSHVEGNKPMESTQVTAALGLLKKTLPDLAAITVSGDQDNPFLIKDISSKPLEQNSAQWLADNRGVIEGETVQ